MRTVQLPAKYAVVAVVCGLGALLVSACGKKEETAAGTPGGETTQGQANTNAGAPGKVSRPNLDPSK